MNEVLVLYYSRQGSTAALARQICRGVEAVAGMQARLRTVAPVTATTQRLDPAVPDEGPPYATHEDLLQCCGLILGSPTRFGNMAAPRQVFLGRHQRPVDLRGPGGQACWRVYLDPDPARRAGVDLAVHDGAPASSWHVLGRACRSRSRLVGHPRRRHSLWREPRRGAGRRGRTVGTRERDSRAPWVAASPFSPIGSQLGHERNVDHRASSPFGSGSPSPRVCWRGPWSAIPWLICVLAVLPLLAPLNGLVRGRRHTYAWATLFAIPYLAFRPDRTVGQPAGALGGRL